MGITLAIVYAASFFAIFSTFIYLLTLYENKEKIRNPKPRNLPSVTVIVPAFNEESRINKTIDSLLNLNYPKQLLEILLIDDGSTDNTLNEMNDYSKNNQIRIFTKKNSGKASALNLGIKKAKGEIIVSLDADSFVDRNALIKMVGYFDNPKIMAVTPAMKIWKPKTILQKIQFFEYCFGIYLRKAASFLNCITVTPGPFSAYRKSFFMKYGGYKENNLTEDIEIALRIQSNNFLIENSPESCSYTIGPSKFMPLFRQRLRWYLGFLNNVWDYRHLLLNRKYGVLGLFYIPSAFLSVFFTAFLVGYTIKKLSNTLLNGISNLNSINFDFTKLIRFNPDAFYLVPSTIAMIAITSIIMMMTILYISRKISNDKEKIVMPFLISLLLYAPLYSLWWITSYAYKMSGKTMKWSGTAWKKD